MGARVHPNAVVEPGAKLADGVVVGPFCHVGSDVELGEGSHLISHVTLLGPSRLGRNNVVYPFASLGTPPQDRSWSGEPTRLEVGDDNVFREQVSVHCGTVKGGSITRIGSHCLLMVGAHVAHDAIVEDDVTLTNLASLGGHVHIGRGAVLAGHVAVAPFVRVGRLAFLAGGARVERDVAPFVIAAGDRARVRALNEVGLGRAAVPEASRRALSRAFRMIWRSGEPMARGLAAARAELGGDACVRELLDFVEASSGR